MGLIQSKRSSGSERQQTPSSPIMEDSRLPEIPSPPTLLSQEQLQPQPQPQPQPPSTPSPPDHPPSIPIEEAVVPIEVVPLEVVPVEEAVVPVEVAPVEAEEVPKEVVSEIESIIATPTEAIVAEETPRPKTAGRNISLCIGARMPITYSIKVKLVRKAPKKNTDSVIEHVTESSIDDVIKAAPAIESEPELVELRSEDS